MYWSICPPSLVVTRHWWHTSKTSRPTSQPPGRIFGIVGTSKTWCFWRWLGRSIRGFCLSGHKEYFLDNLPFLTPLFAAIFASIPLVSFHMRSGSMIFASFACFSKDKEKMGMMDFYKNFEIWERKKYHFSGLRPWLYIFKTAFLLMFYFLLSLSVLRNLLIMSLLEKCMRSSSSCSN